MLIQHPVRIWHHLSLCFVESDFEKYALDDGKCPKKVRSRSLGRPPSASKASVRGGGTQLGEGPNSSTEVRATGVSGMLVLHTVRIRLKTDPYFILLFEM